MIRSWLVKILVLRRLKRVATHLNTGLLALMIAFMVYIMAGGTGILAGNVTTGQEFGLIVLYVIIISVGTLGVYLGYLAFQYKYIQGQSVYLTLGVFLILGALLIGMAIT